jgi:molecular chaperone GrpE
VTDRPTEETTDETVADQVTVSSDDVTPEELSETDAVAAERDVFRDTAQRLQADFENYRKRVLKQQTEAAERANEALVTKLLTVLDTIDLARAHDPNGSLEQVSVSLLDVLTKEGLERIVAVDEPFDPTLHEAVAHEPGGGEAEPHVGEELRAGYRWKGRVVRPAMVKVIG